MAESLAKPCWLALPVEKQRNICRLSVKNFGVCFRVAQRPTHFHLRGTTIERVSQSKRQRDTRLKIGRIFAPPNPLQANFIFPFHSSSYSCPDRPVGRL